MQLEGRVALVTGASRGIGRAIAAAMAREGADLVLASRTQEALESLADEVKAQGRRALVVPTDVAVAEQVRALSSRAKEWQGHIDILVNSTGVIDNVPIAGHSEEAWHHVMGVNLHSYFYTIKEVIGEMLERRSGRILNIASTSSKVPIGPNRAAYVTSKHALIGLTREVAVEAAPFGVTVNALCPGFVWSDMVRQSMANFARDSNMTWEEAQKSWEQKIPIGRFIDPEEMVPLALYLVSDAGAGVTGQAMSVDGGYTMA